MMLQLALSEHWMLELHFLYLNVEIIVTVTFIRFNEVQSISLLIIVITFAMDNGKLLKVNLTKLTNYGLAIIVFIGGG